MSEEWLAKGFPSSMLPPAAEEEERPSIPRTLTPEEIEVCEEILAGSTPRVAFRKITRKSSQDAFYRFMEHPEAKVYMAMRRAEIRESELGGEDPAKEWFRQVHEMAYYDPAEIVMEEVNGPKDILKLPEHVRRLINGWRWDKAGNFIVDFVDRSKALDMIARYWGLYQADRENDQDVARSLLTKAFWRFIMALHMQKGLTIQEAYVVAQREPDAVREFARANNLLPAPDQ